MTNKEHVLFMSAVLIVILIITSAMVFWGLPFWLVLVVLALFTCGMGIYAKRFIKDKIGGTGITTAHIISIICGSIVLPLSILMLINANDKRYTALSVLLLIVSISTISISLIHFFKSIR